MNKIIDNTQHQCLERSSSPYDPLHQRCALDMGHVGQHQQTILGHRTTQERINALAIEYYKR